MKSFCLVLLMNFFVPAFAFSQDEKKAADAMEAAENFYRNDDMRKALNGDGQSTGFLGIINQYPNTHAGRLALFYAGSCHIKLGEYKSAIKHLTAFTTPSKPLQARAYKLLGDAYGDTDDFKNAFQYYKKAAITYENDRNFSAECLFLAGYLAQIMLENTKEAQLQYEELIKKYPETNSAAEAKTRLQKMGLPVNPAVAGTNNVITAAERINVYLPLIKGKSVGIFANQTSVVGKTHLVDTLRSLGVNVKVIFGPEHGFRGTADAGEKVGNYTDAKTGIPVVSLYGTKRRPSADDLKGVDVLIFDIQDVGVRFYTYISSLEEFMEAAFEHKVPLLLLDRPNPNGFYVDGPVLDTKYKSFVGRQPIPIVYGMTIGEYAMMLTGENWLSEKANAYANYFKKVEQHHPDTPFHFLTIKCKQYDHKTKYVLPVKPSPNLPNIQSIYLYPSTCLFEGTVLSEGRGTNKPFQVFGHPLLPKTLYSFTPNPNEGAKSSKLYGQVCYGWDVSGTPEEVLAKLDNKIQLKWLLEAYNLFPKGEKFFIEPKSGKMEESFFAKLSGNNQLRQQVMEGATEEAIRKSWEPQLTEFKKIRKKYLLYDDFE